MSETLRASLSNGTATAVRALHIMKIFCTAASLNIWPFSRFKRFTLNVKFIDLTDSIAFDELPAAAAVKNGMTVDV